MSFSFCMQLLQGLKSPPCMPACAPGVFRWTCRHEGVLMVVRLSWQEWDKFIQIGAAQPETCRSGLRQSSHQQRLNLKPVARNARHVAVKAKHNISARKNRAACHTIHGFLKDHVLKGSIKAETEYLEDRRGLHMFELCLNADMLKIAYGAAATATLSHWFLDCKALLMHGCESGANICHHNSTWHILVVVARCHQSRHTSNCSTRPLKAQSSWQGYVCICNRFLHSAIGQSQS